MSSGRTATSRDPAAAVSRTSFAAGVLRRRREGEAGGEVGWAGDGAAARVAQDERRGGQNVFSDPCSLLASDGKFTTF